MWKVKLDSVKWFQDGGPFAYKPSYSGGRDQENYGLKIAGKQFMRPYLKKKKITKQGWYRVEWFKV
jgi:hypothetical protein